MNITFDQIRGPVERLIYVGLGWLVARGFITNEEVANYATLALGILAAFYGWWQNRPKAIMQSAAAIKGTTVVTSPDLAKSTGQNNVVSSDDTEASVATAIKRNK